MKKQNLITLLFFSLLIFLLLSCNDSGTGLFQAAKTAEYQIPYNILSLLGGTKKEGDAELYFATDKGLIVLDNNGVMTELGEESGNLMKSSFYAERNNNNDLVYYYFDNSDSSLYSKIPGKEKELIGRLDGFSFISAFVTFNSTISSDWPCINVLFREQNPNSSSTILFKTYNSYKTKSQFNPSTLLSNLEDTTKSPTLAISGMGYSLSTGVYTEDSSDTYNNSIALDSNMSVIKDRSSESGVWVVGVSASADDSKESFAIYSDGIVSSSSNRNVDLDVSFENYTEMPSIISNSGTLTIFRPLSSTYYRVNTNTMTLNSPQTRADLASISPFVILGNGEDYTLLINGDTAPASMDLSQNLFRKLGTNNKVINYI